MRLTVVGDRAEGKGDETLLLLSQLVSDTCRGLARFITGQPTIAVALQGPAINKSRASGRNVKTSGIGFRKWLTKRRDAGHDLGPIDCFLFGQLFSSRPRTLEHQVKRVSSIIIKHQGRHNGPSWSTDSFLSRPVAT